MKSKTNYLNPEDFKMVLDAVPKLELRRYDPRDIQFLFKLCYHCALRITAAINVKVEDINLEDREIYLGKYKNRENYYQNIPAEFIPELENYIEGKSGRLFDMNRNTVDFWIRKLGKMLDITAWNTPQSTTKEKTKCHIFRKSQAKDMLLGTHGKKANIFIVSKHLGHTSVKTTEDYLKMDNLAVKEFFDLSEELI